MSEELDLAQVLVSRICHDLVSPVGAITNGLEVLEDEEEADMRDTAIRLITQSAESAAAKLQFMRVAFGAGRSLPDRFGAHELRSLAEGVLHGTRGNVEWQLAGIDLDRYEAKVVLIATLVAAEGLPRGGIIRVSAGNRFRVEAEGVNARLPEGVNGMVPETLEPREIAPVILHRLARGAGRTISAAATGNGFRIDLG